MPVLTRNQRRQVLLQDVRAVFQSAVRTAEEHNDPALSLLLMKLRVQFEKSLKALPECDQEDL